MAALDLPRMVRRLGSRRASVTFPPIFPPQSLVDELAAIYVKVARAWRNQAAEQLLPIYGASIAQTRDSPEEASSQMGASEATVSRLVVTLGPDIDRWVVRAETIHRTKFIAAAKTAAGVDLGTLIGPEGVERTLRAAYEENLALIRNIDDDMRSKIGQIIFRGFQARTPRRQVAKEINEAVQIGRARSLRIASDQTTKLSSILDQERQEEIGISQFVWQHSGKVHYRPVHKARDGKIYSWQKNNLNGDLPGRAIHCGCKSRAYVDFGSD